MSCPTCDHTMQRVDTTDGEEFRRYWCPRCGTLKHENSHEYGFDSDQAPFLVERVRTLLGSVNRNVASRLGVTESVYLPDQRPQ